VGTEQNGPPPRTDDRWTARWAARWAALWRRLPVPARVLIEAVNHFLNTNATLLAGYIAYAALLALFPFLIFLATLGGFLGREAAVIEAFGLALARLPPEVAEVLETPIREVLEEQRPGLLTASVLVTLWVASNGFEALRAGLNEAYEIEEPRALWWRRLQSLALTLLFAAAVVASTIAVVLGPIIWRLVEWLLELPLPVLWQLLWAAVRYSLAGGALLVVTWALYYFLPNVRMRGSDALPGAAVAVALWTVAASLFSWYLANLGRFTVTYGSLGGVVLSLFFFYVSAAIFIFGAEINAAIRRLAARAAARALAESAAGR
jgi:membrane protein